MFLIKFRSKPRPESEIDKFSSFVGVKFSSTGERIFVQEEIFVWSTFMRFGDAIDDSWELILENPLNINLEFTKKIL